MSISWNLPKKSSSKPIQYLIDFMTVYEDNPEDEVAPLLILPILIDIAYQEMQNGRANIHHDAGHGSTAQTLAKTLVECISEWITCMSVSSDNDKICILDTVFNALPQINGHVSDWQSPYVCEEASKSLALLFKDNIPAWKQSKNTSGFTSLEWMYYAHIVVSTPSCHEHLIDTYKDLWNHVATHGNDESDMISNSTNTDPGYFYVFQILLPGIAQHAPNAMLEWSSFLRDELDVHGLNLSYSQSMHASYLHSLLEYTGKQYHAKDDSLRQWFSANKDHIPNVKQYTPISLLSVDVQSHDKNDILTYVDSKWFQHQILSERISTSDIWALMFVFELDDKRHILDASIRPILSSNMDDRNYRRGLYNNSDESKEVFIHLCMSKDLPIRILAVAYMLRMFNPSDATKTPFPNKEHRKTRPYGRSLFSKTDKMLSTFIPELMPLWEIYADIHNAGPNDARKQSAFLWDYYEQHFGLAKSTEPLEISFDHVA